MKIITLNDQELPITELEYCLSKNESFTITKVKSFNLMIKELQ